MHGTSVPG